mmetsp:Transcript_121200/g.387191  ORF Transcript_121200/g.387191 Transcript_121200/m.387191 type:complete len:280 (+) Transcript_121200:652-1491(+)
MPNVDEDVRVHHRLPIAALGLLSLIDLVSVARVDGDVIPPHHHQKFLFIARLDPRSHDARCGHHREAKERDTRGAVPGGLHQAQALRAAEDVASPRHRGGQRLQRRAAVAAARPVLVELEALEAVAPAALGRCAILALPRTSQRSPVPEHLAAPRLAVLGAAEAIIRARGIATRRVLVLLVALGARPAAAPRRSAVAAVRGALPRGLVHLEAHRRIDRASRRQLLTSIPERHHQESRSDHNACGRNHRSQAGAIGPWSMQCRRRAGRATVCCMLGKDIA